MHKKIIAKFKVDTRTMFKEDLIEIVLYQIRDDEGGYTNPLLDFTGDGHFSVEAIPDLLNAIKEMNEIYKEYKKEGVKNDTFWLKMKNKIKNKE